MNKIDFSSLSDRIFTRTGHWYPILVEVLVRTITTPFLILLIAIMVQVNTDLSQTQATNLLLFGGGMLLFRNTVLLIQVYASTRDVFARLSQPARPVSAEAEAAQEERAWKQISALAGNILISGMAATFPLVVFPVSVYAYFALNLNLESLIYIGLAIIAATQAILLFDAALGEFWLLPARAALLPRQYEAQLAGMKVKGIGLYSKFQSSIMGLTSITLLVVIPIAYHQSNLILLDTSHSPQLLSHALVRMLMAGAGTIVTGIILSSSLARTVARSPRQLIEAFKEIEKGNLNQRVKISATDELGELSIHFNQMISRLQEITSTLELRVELRTVQLLASADIGRAATSILDPERLLKEAVNLITDRFGFYYTAVFTPDETDKWLVLREATGEAGRILKERGHKLKIGEPSMVSNVFTQRKLRVALDASTDAVRFANPLLPETRSEIALPLIVGERVLGALDVQSTQAAAFDETNAAVLQVMADQIAIALSNAGQFRQTEATLQNTRNLFAASQALSAATDTDSILRALIDHVTPDASRAGITLSGPRDETGQPAYFEFAATWVQADFAAITQLIRTGARFTPQQLPVVSSVTPMQPLVVPDASADDVPPGLRTFMHRFGAEALAALALAAGQNPLGILIVGYRQARTFSADYIQTLVTLSSQVAIVIQNRRSLAETQATLAQLDQLNRRLTGEAWQAYTAPLGGALKVRDVAPGAQNASTPAVLDAPIVVRGEPIGALKLQDVDPDRAWSANDRTLLEAVANEIAVAIDNARLLEQAERRAQREQLISEVSRKMLAASNIQGIIQIAGDELSRALQVGRTEVKLGSELAAVQFGLPTTDISAAVSQGD